MHFYPGARAARYPAVRHWDQSGFARLQWESDLAGQVNGEQAVVSLYIHLPFCESMCTFCACHKRITTDHNVENPYIRAILAEWKMYCQLFGNKPVIKELHLGGGTPTFFSPGHLQDLVNGIFCLATVAPQARLSFEGHPNTTSKAHLAALANLGFRYVSFGVQDYSQKIQKAINRFQPLCNVARVSLWAKELGYEVISHDIVFGLPFQNQEDIVDTIEKTLSIRPDRIAFHAYSHQPWEKGTLYRGFADHDVPAEDYKVQLFTTGRDILLSQGYREAGMEHFELCNDGIEIAPKARHVPGMISQPLIGLGVSAIGHSGGAYVRNAANLEDYHQLVEWGQLPVAGGHHLTQEDLAARQHIVDLMTGFRTRLIDNGILPIRQILADLVHCQNHGWIKLEEMVIQVTDNGKPFIRNTCAAFDLRRNREHPRNPLFSTAV